jgi:hypothetical protein
MARRYFEILEAQGKFFMVRSAKMTVINLDDLREKMGAIGRRGLSWILEAARRDITDAHAKSELILMRCKHDPEGAPIHMVATYFYDREKAAADAQRSIDEHARLLAFIVEALNVLDKIDMEEWKQAVSAHWGTKK